VLSPTSLNFGAAGGEGRFTVTTQAGCEWKASSGASWAVVTSGSGTGSGEVVYAVQPNTEGARSTSITVGSQAHSVMQSASDQM
jgi:Viral BACON domain